MTARPTTLQSEASSCLKAAHSEAHCCYQIKSCLVRDPHVQASDGDPSKTHWVPRDHNLDSWPGSLNLTGSWPCWRWNMEDIRFTLTLAFSTSDFYMRFPLTLTDEELPFLFFWEKHTIMRVTGQSFIFGANTYVSAIRQPSWLVILITTIKNCHPELADTAKQALHTKIGRLPNPRCVFR